MRYAPKASAVLEIGSPCSKERAVLRSCQQKTAAAGASIRTSASHWDSATGVAPGAAISPAPKAAPASAAIEHAAAVRKPGKVDAARLAGLSLISRQTIHCPATLTKPST